MVCKVEVRHAQIATKVTKLASGAASVSYNTGKYYGAVMFDPQGDYLEATMTTQSAKGRGFVKSRDLLPKGVYDAARAALRESQSAVP